MLNQALWAVIFQTVSERHSVGHSVVLGFYVWLCDKACVWIGLRTECGFQPRSAIGVNTEIMSGWK